MDKKLQKRLLELLYKNNEEHIGSCFSGLEIIDNIFKTKSKDDKFILSCGHLGFALYTVIEKISTTDKFVYFQIVICH